MTTKKIKIIRGKTTEDIRTDLAEVVILKKRPAALSSQGKTIEEIAREQGIPTIKDDADFNNIFGEYKEWFDVDAFLKEVHQPWK